VLNKLARYDEAELSFERSLSLKASNFGAWYGQACCYALQGRVNLALENLHRAMQCSPSVVRSMLKRDRRFDRIRATAAFQQLLQLEPEDKDFTPLTTWSR
jgi:tetratricopeptide (TPR) repeat protein